ncbi:peptidoglycan DD-metalloendopeptidase family protein [Kiloniella sp. b19]|uniref:peptidoglycan DD-metalloendopeptidase family protein n=1 Tax=Kiloniella sp. GXU_MW_B19 TaxID=3141326 RepID=UPI0031DB21F2
MRFDDKSLGKTLTRFWDRAFTPREIHFSSENKVVFLRFSRRFQQLMSASALCLLAGVGYAGVVYQDLNETIAAKQQSIAEERLKYFELLQLVGEYHTQFSKITEDLQYNQGELLSLLEAGEGDNALSADEALKTLRKSEAEKHRVLAARQEVEDRLRAFEGELDSIPAQGDDLVQRISGLRENLGLGLGEGDLLDDAEISLGQLVAKQERQLISLNTRLRDQKQLEQQIEKLTAELKSEQDKVSSTGKSLVRALDEKRVAEAQLAQAFFEKDDLEVELTSYVDRSGDLDDELERLKTSTLEAANAQRELLVRLMERSKGSIDMIETTVEMTGLDMDKLMGVQGDDARAQGGPFIPEEGYEEERLWHASIMELGSYLDRWDALQEVVSKLPLAAPMDQYRVTSSFGKRRDPVTGRTARHNGMDLAAPMRSSVYAPAPGKVVYAGWRGRYGRFVEIDHGNGIRTRYAHLNKIMVERGQTVSHREKIALLGNSGRSTGPHVHYEVLFNGQHVDPRNFVKAGKHVFKTQ